MTIQPPEKGMPDKIRQFIIFAIEEYRDAKDMPGKEAFALFETSGLLDYIEEFYDVLHSQGGEYLICDFDEYLSSRGYSPFKKPNTPANPE